MDTLTSDVPVRGIGDNSGAATLSELLFEETAPLRARASELAVAADRAAELDEGKATTLVAMVKQHIDTINAARETRKKPAWDECKTIDGHFGVITGSLATFDKGKLVGGPLHRAWAVVDNYRREREAKAASERARLEEAARLEREKAAAAVARQQAAEERERRAAEESARQIQEAESRAAAAKSDAERQAAARLRAEAEALSQIKESESRARALAAELERRQFEEDAARLDQQAAAAKAGPIVGLGAKAFSRPTWRAELGSKAEDLTAALRHCRRIDEKTLRTCVETIYARQVKAGVRELPGAKIIEDSATTIRR